MKIKVLATKHGWLIKGILYLYIGHEKPIHRLDYFSNKI
jgi:hypothetical protein